MTGFKIMKYLILIFALFAGAADAHTKRSYAAKMVFVREHACPATGLHKLPCAGWIIDHRVGLCVGGPDKPENLRWMTLSEAKAKDKWECKPGWKEKLIECEAKGCFGV